MERKVLNNTKSSFEEDITAIQHIGSVPTMLEVICSSTGMGFAAVARVTEDRWIACEVRDEIGFGLQPGGELKIDSTICHEIRQSGKGVIIDHVENDPVYVCHHTPAMYGFQSYISIPILLKDGSFFGTLCAIDPKPAKLNNPKIIGMFMMFADLISTHLNAYKQNALIETKLQEEREMAELREQFIAVLAHDLRNPINAISNSAQLQLRLSDDEDMTMLSTIIKNSSYRMNGMIENVLDFARGKFGDGIKLHNRQVVEMGGVLQEVIDELQVIWPSRKIKSTFSLEEPVSCDSGRIAQLFSNLLNNALTYGKDDGRPVTVWAISRHGTFTLAVGNASERIPDTILSRIFKPFSRGDANVGQKGLGLGLYISSEIARAHGGTLEVESGDQETVFTLTMPSNFFTGDYPV